MVFLVLMVMVLLNLLIAIMSDAAARASGVAPPLQALHVHRVRLYLSHPRAVTLLFGPPC